MNKSISESTSDLLYTEEVVHFLRSLLDDVTVFVAWQIAYANKNNEGLVKSRLPHYQSKRRSYDDALTALYAQGHIRYDGNATMKPIYLTDRGLQLLNVLKKERENAE
ncbi:hypothetical protein L2089_15530 [Paenibacillus hunanensis]|uniref:hypothetical protein n=1 Tax=Paenibacillus hunanensis TaxID=539262 RepID=UPI0020264EF0|nr:hypothetical protein [Paenibacillus hunanensis]MCL9662105.1 hypothetical protein [Paenibacillus hunanensis]